jgi:hypothetical protein
LVKRTTVEHFFVSDFNRHAILQSFSRRSALPEWRARDPSKVRGLYPAPLLCSHAGSVEHQQEQNQLRFLASIRTVRLPEHDDFEYDDDFKSFVLSVHHVVAST